MEICTSGIRINHERRKQANIGVLVAEGLKMGIQDGVDAWNRRASDDT